MDESGSAAHKATVERQPGGEKQKLHLGSLVNVVAKRQISVLAIMLSDLKLLQFHAGLWLLGYCFWFQFQAYNKKGQLSLL